MLTFLAFDFSITAGVGRGAWLTVITAAMAVLAVLVGRVQFTVTLLALSGMTTVITLASAVTGYLVPVGFGEVAGISILASEVARRRPVREAAITIGVAFLAITLSGTLRDPRDTGLLAVFWFVFTLAVTAGLTIRWSERSQVLLTESVQREERLDIARELHDSVAHHVTGIVIQAQAARAVGASNPAAVDAALARIEEAGGEAMAAMRRLVGALRADDDTPLTPTTGGDDLHGRLDDLVDGLRHDGIGVTVETVPIPDSYAPTVQRVVQEAVTNIRRHAARVSRVDVTVTAEDDGIRVKVIDDGEPVERASSSGFGLVGMAERVAALDGHFWAGPRPDRGWSVTVWLPRAP